MRTSIVLVSVTAWITGCSSTSVINEDMGTGGTPNGSSGGNAYHTGGNAANQSSTRGSLGGTATTSSATSSTHTSPGGTTFGGMSAATGGATSLGSSTATGGSSMASGGASATPATTGGVFAATGGASTTTATSGGSANGGSNPATGGTSASPATGGIGITGGSAATTGGTSASVGIGGSAAQIGGTSAQSETGGVSSGGSATGGAPNTGAPATGGASAVDMPDLVDLQRTRFVDYGKLRIGVRQEVQPTSVRILLAPAKPARLGVTSITSNDATTLDVTLAYYHLPIDYELSISGILANGNSFTTVATIPGLNNGSRVAFVTKEYGTGNLRNWPSAPASATTGREAGDGICQAEATAAGLKGTFVALLSSSTAAQGRYDAGCRAFGLMGTLPNCAQTSLPVDNAPWLSLDGLPIVEGATGIVGNRWLTPIPFHADGTGADTGEQSYRSLSWGGTEPDLTASPQDCAGWSDGTSNGYGFCIAFPGEYLPEFDSHGGDCTKQLKLVCLQVSGTFFGPNTLHHVSGKRAFMSTGKLTGAMSLGEHVGIGAADQLCQSDALAAGVPNAASFRAYLTTNTDDALCHVLGASGTVANLCGLSSLPTASWRRLDDYPLATPAQLILDSDQHLTTPVLYAADGTRVVTTRERIWTGTGWDFTGNLTCSDWSVTNADGYSGVATAITSGWSLFAAIPGTTSQRVYCFEK